MASNRDAFDCKNWKWGKHCDASNPASSEIFEIRLPGYDVKQSTCFLPETDKEPLFWLKLYGNYKDGHLLNSGGISNQPAPYMEAMRFIKWLVTQESESQQKTGRGQQ